jgi:broad specificity phosphatase PhoE
LIDAGLTEFGKQQAIKVKNQLNWKEIDIVFVSPLKRAL